MLASTLNTLKARGLLQDVSDPNGLKKLPPGTSFYVGFDPTSPYLHIGNLIQLIVSVHLARGGLKPIFLFGGATGSIGDPSGKSSERPLLDRETIDANVESHKKIFRSIVERLGVEIEFVNNFEWTKNVSVIEFLRDVGKHFTVSYMIAKEVVKTRLGEEGISYTEFSYMVLQAFDFLHLYDNKNCKLQIGGSDQWGNITAGLELIRRKRQGEAYALSIPLLTDAQGKKFGKSESGAVWISKDGMTPYRFHQFWLNTEDSEVGRLLRVFTFLTEDEIQDLEKKIKESPEKREAQKALADAVCTLVHGEDSTHEAKRSAEVLFGGSIDGIPDESLLEIFKEVPSSTFDRSTLSALTLVDLLVETKLAPSKGEARRLIQNGGAYLNNERIQEGTLTVGKTSALSRAVSVLRSGKKNYHLLQVRQ